MNEQFTKEQLEKAVLCYANNSDPVECGIDEATFNSIVENIQTIEIGDDVVEHKTVYNSNIYLVEGIYFEVTFTRDNSGYWGYWGDGERYAPTICEVYPKEVTKTVYLAKKPD